MPFERKLSKADCLRMFNAGELSNTGTMTGVYRWATSLDSEDERNASE